MALLPILCYPDPKLSTVARPVAAVDARIKALISDMLDTMHEAKGIGLAATQVDVHAVSYTHLDVYKRQIARIAPVSLPICRCCCKACAPA